MNARAIAQAIRGSRERATEVSGPLSATDLASVANILDVRFHQIYVSPAPGEMLRVSVPVDVPIRNVPMGERAR